MPGGAIAHGGLSWSSWLKSEPDFYAYCAQNAEAAARRAKEAGASLIAQMGGKQVGAGARLPSLDSLLAPLRELSYKVPALSSQGRLASLLSLLLVLP